MFFLPAVYLRAYVALCGVRVIVHLIGEQRHEEREAGNVSRARLSAVESLGGNTSTGLHYPQIKHEVVVMLHQHQS